jgi:hypothetical protein
MMLSSSAVDRVWGDRLGTTARLIAVGLQESGPGLDHGQDGGEGQPGQRHGGREEECGTPILTGLDYSSITGLQFSHFGVATAGRPSSGHARLSQLGTEAEVARGYLRVHLRDEIVTPPVAKFGRSLGACLSFWRGEAALQPLHVIEVNVEDTVIGQFGAVERGDESGRLVPLEVGYFVDQRHVRVGIVLLESRRVLGVPVQHGDLYHVEPPFTRGCF